MAAKGRGPIPRWTNFFLFFDESNTGSISGSNAAAIQIAKRGNYFREENIALAQDLVEELLQGLINAGENTNGSVTLEQWLATVHKIVIGKPVSEAPEWWKNTMKKIYTTWEKSSTGMVSEDEFIALITSVTQSISKEMAANVHKQIPNPLTNEIFQEMFWTWAASLVAVPEDIYLNLVLRERAKEKMKQVESTQTQEKEQNQH